MLNVNIHRLLAWVPGLGSCDSAAQRFSALPPHFSILEGEKYSASVLKPLQTRRMSELTKIVADVALQICANEKIDHILLSSRHGELASSSQLLQMIADKEVLSPTLFSQSVHNTAIGTYTLFNKTHVATTALGGGKDGFMMGLVSAYAYLQAHPEAQVLYISADEMIPEVLAGHVKEDNKAFVVALLLKANTANTKIKFIQNSGGQAVRETDNLPQTVAFLEWICANSPEVRLAGEERSWELRKC